MQALQLGGHHYSGTSARLLGAEAPSWLKNGLENAHCSV